MFLPLPAKLAWPKTICAVVFGTVIVLANPAFGQSCSSPCPQPVPAACPCNPNGVPIDTCSYPNNHGCPNGDAPAEGICCCAGSPVLISLIEDPHSESDAFPLTTLAKGIQFPITADPALVYPVSWTTAHTQVAFVVHLPSDYIPGKEYIFDGRDLFGNFTPQPPPTKGHPANGYEALLVWDRPENGGNGDGLISSADQAVQRGIAPEGIVLWIDDNHDGIAQPEEIHTFDDKGLESISASEYKESRWTDYAGNKFRYTAPIHLVSGKRGRSVDVFFVLGPSSSH